MTFLKKIIIGLCCIKLCCCKTNSFLLEYVLFIKEWKLELDFLIFFFMKKNKQYTSESVVTLFRTKHYDYDQSG